MRALCRSGANYARKATSAEILTATKENPRRMENINLSQTLGPTKESEDFLRLQIRELRRRLKRRAVPAPLRKTSELRECEFEEHDDKTLRLIEDVENRNQILVPEDKNKNFGFLTSQNGYAYLMRETLRRETKYVL